MISAVTVSISRSSAVRSVKPGRACFACNLSRAFTTWEMNREANEHDGGRRSEEHGMYCRNCAYF